MLFAAHRTPRRRSVQAEETYAGNALGTIKNAAVADPYATANSYYVEGDILFPILLPGQTVGISAVKAETSVQPAYRLSGQRAKETDKGIIVKEGRKYLMK